MSRILRLGTVVVLAGLAIVGALRAASMAPAAQQGQAVVTRDPQLARCRSAGEAGGRDPTCQAAWRKARQRFLGEAAS